ncbi:hypothetical protein [Dyadobacter psychrotolerans]|uniref:Uncharacterized protein n=1 Tax=Dyadobacter psychrotolerans TaxID=2541721 RepID=A0A4R5DTW0_9BACT|nr:hypothetical protein [Dyadobacter psychrotolerans]TDE14585.1 hypothetical protein E0F88_15435 [Dyadobacter psychrotolerans]
MRCTVQIKKILISALLLFTASAFAQESAGEKAARNIGLLLAPWHERLPPHKSYVRDNSNIKPENFRFRDAPGRSLNDRLSVGVGAKTPDCKPSWAMFKFRVNGKGLVDSTWSDGNLPKEVSNRFVDNIHATDGSWIVASGTKETEVAWYVYFYSDTRGLWDRNLNCSDSDKELQKTVSYMTSFFYNLFYCFGEDKATMVRPTDNNGIPRN